MTFLDSNVCSNIIIFIDKYGFHWKFQLLMPHPTFNTCLFPLLPPFSTPTSFFLLFYPCDYLLQTSLGIIHIYMFQTYINLVIICSILVCLWHDMTKIKTFINQLKFQRMTINNRMLCCWHKRQIIAFIFHKGNHTIHLIKLFK
jgi:hypothetical protein